ncbi:hypothetical protein J1N35_013154 [Gossypium stocksii]|uniref:Uncharacterized protein n=1 Tax=Gossypium stocksii TaxID=47602 RepID=A0A9D3VT79_9ROSI|nr:hypothetical protein J1N35_013154 [Gossypium stocksii]
MEKFDDEKYRWYKSKTWDNLYGNQESSWLNGVSMNQWSDDKGCGEHLYSYESLFLSYDQKNYMLKHLDKPLGDSYEVPSCETTKLSNFELLLDMSNMMAQMRKMF